MFDCLTMIICWGFQLGKWGIPKFAGWCMLGKIPSSKMDDDWGYPYFRTPPYVEVMFWDRTRWTRGFVDGVLLLES